ncbi:MAG: 4-(cytidine 5'-diphospho)-2-C-methyl-D-erythritol kinase [Candidatus Eisenbacteria bacterium]|uniref:4-diphosphocytidyl-2-C-methyl-D-erythritol kinase n=1 Tax=Eiseniibacteriota bacterium TaxID=2212470 RepID=A0A9D6L8K2_UNCEI|nr:4-(cytidine 5'-diphospho)-2-C-methyl-D-erythritol kinase [Candidatus Eisenbacteria bacterium]MBI3538900.1 4-(cytidine 5'-diphospho)-2-C-methyl-D-erythritol kinase [Candidatus Eisenbacteria bacterium]
MSVRPARVRVEARAKLNLGLAVGPRRADGFHDLATVFQSISLADTLTVERRTRGFSLAIRYEDASVRRAGLRGRGRIPAGRDNLVLRAARLVAARYRLTGGAHFHLVKRIPAGAGLGGGSADAAAAIAGLARLHGLAIAPAERPAIGAALGSDVPFALFGGTALGLGRGERLRRLRLAAPFRALIALPPWRVSTAAAFRAMDRGKYGLTGWGSKLRIAQRIGREAITPNVVARLGNSFEGVPGKHRAEFLSLRDRLRVAGVEAPHLTGTGSAVFGVIRAGRPGQHVVERFAGSETVFLVRSRGRGLTIITLP